MMTEGTIKLTPEIMEEARRLATHPTFSFRKIEPNYTVHFHNATGEVGVLDFNGDTMKFTGNADESAQVFLDSVVMCFKQRMAECRAQAIQEVIAEWEKPYGLTDGTPFIDRLRRMAK